MIHIKNVFMNTDVFNFFDEIINQNQDELVIFKDEYDKFIRDRNYHDNNFSINFCLEDFDATAEVADWIDKYICSFNQSQMNSIICNYGINKAMELLYNSYAMETLMNQHDLYQDILDHKSEKKIIELIFYDKVNFWKDWKDSSPLHLYI